MTSKRYRVLVVDDSEVARDMLAMLFALSTDFEVVGMASDGREGVQLAGELKPDLVTMDLHMPHLNGYDAVEQIMAFHPTAILVITSYRESETAFRCISLGALDVMDKPDVTCIEDATFIRDFLEEARLLASTKVIRRPLLKSKQTPTVQVPQRKPAATAGDTASHLVAIASSTGGPQALHQVLMNLPAEFPAAILIVQHLAAGFEAGLVSWLSTTTALPLALATAGAPLVAGTVLFAPPLCHVGVDENRHVCFIDAPPVAGHKPSAKFLFESGASIYGAECTGVILTGMGADGAEALGHISLAGGLTIAQDEESSTIFGMPKAAIELGSAQEIHPLTAIAPRLTEWVSS